MDFYRKIDKIIAGDPRYRHDAYEFVMQALWYTQEEMKRKGHITGRELCEGIRRYAVEQYGPLAKTVFDHWGIRKTDDFGEIVFSMVDHKLLGKTETDSKEDFKDIYDFSAAFSDENTL